MRLAAALYAQSARRSFVRLWEQAASLSRSCVPADRGIRRRCHCSLQLSVPRLVLLGLKRVVISVLCPDLVRRDFAVACETFALRAASKVLTLHLKYEPPVARQMLMGARPTSRLYGRVGHKLKHGMWSLLRPTKPFVLCQAGSKEFPGPKAVGYLGFHALLPMDSVRYGSRDKACTSMTRAGESCAEQAGKIGEVAIREHWDLAPPEMVEEARRRDVWYDKDKDEEGLVGEFGFVGPRMYSARGVQVLDLCDRHVEEKVRRRV